MHRQLSGTILHNIQVKIIVNTHTIKQLLQIIKLYFKNMHQV